MGTCTSNARRQTKNHRSNEFNQSNLLDKKHLASFQSTVHPNQRPQSLLTDFEFHSSILKQPIVHRSNTNSLVQLYSYPLTNQCSQSKSSIVIHRFHESSLSSSSSITTTSTGSLRLKTIGNRHPEVFIRPMSTSKRPSIPQSSKPISPTRFGFVRRTSTTTATTTASGAQSTPIQQCSRSVSPSATTATNTINKSSKLSTNSIGNSQLRSNIPLRASHISSSTMNPTVQSTKTDVNVTRDRYKAPQRSNMFNRQIVTDNSLNSPSIIIQRKPLNISSNRQNKQNCSNRDSAYASLTLSSNHNPSTKYLSSSSLLSDVLNEDFLLNDDNCSLKSNDLICNSDDTLTLESSNKNEWSDSCSSNSVSVEKDKQPIMIRSTTTTKLNLSPFQNLSINDNLRESLEELTRLSNQMDNIVFGDNHRTLPRSVSMKPPTTSLPPRDDSEHVIMDIESYRQIMKDVTVVKTILHQLDRLLKDSDAINMTDSMIGSFHESMNNSRHYSSSSIDENCSYDDLIQELTILRKEKEQDKETIKLLQEQMYKYSSKTNGSF